MNSFLSWVGGKNYGNTAQRGNKNNFAKKYASSGFKNPHFRSIFLPLPLKLFLFFNYAVFPYLKKEIVNRFPQKFEKYIEVFGGAAWVLFYKKKSGYEVYNDLNSDLVNLFKCVKFHLPELKRELCIGLNSRQLFNEMKESLNFEGLTDIQRSARFFMLIKTSYGSKGEHFGCVKKDINKMTDYLEMVQKRLCNVIIENMSFEKIIERYDKKDVFFYLDPPYYGSEKYYQAQFSEDEHIKLADMLKQVKGKFLLSYNDCDYVKELYSQFNVEAVERFSSLSLRYEKGDSKYRELIIRNY